MASNRSSMDLFNQNQDYINNLLPYDGTVKYYGKMWSHVEADSFYHNLLHNIDWRNDEAVIFGKLIVTKRKVAWYGDKEFDYSYSNRTKKAKPWSPLLQQLKTQVEQLTGEKFNSCLLNLYHNGSEGMAWHSDGEKTLKKNGAIASISFGAERKFVFKHKESKETVSVLLQHGSLLVMKDATQTNWLHRLPPTKKFLGPRVNLTFRMIVGQ